MNIHSPREKEGGGVRLSLLASKGGEGRGDRKRRTYEKCKNRPTDRPVKEIYAPFFSRSPQSKDESFER